MGAVLGIAFLVSGFASAQPPLAPGDDQSARATPSALTDQASTGPARAEQNGPAADAPWKLAEAVGVDWLQLRLEHRMRYESLRNDFRSGAHRRANALSLRTLAHAEFRWNWAALGVEVIDARAYASDSAPWTNQIVDPLDLLRAYGAVRARGLFATGDALSVTMGRMTMDLGSRRLLARNEFRNTVNAFTGIDMRWTSARQDALRAFAVAPVVRRPSGREELADNRLRPDRENVRVTLVGAAMESRPLAARLRVEAYALGLLEQDGPATPSSNRGLVTEGARLLRAPEPGAIDGECEVMVQHGTSRASTSQGDSHDLRHRAASVHMTAGYQLSAPWRFRFTVLYDYASGDRDPGDNVNGRFDPLFGARRFELGPTGIYGALARSNLSSPGLRVESMPHRAIDVFAAYRPVWLAASKDAWGAAGLRDPRGESGRFVGHQVEGRARVRLFRKNLSLELGAAYLKVSTFAAEVDGGSAKPAMFTYVQATGTI